MMALISNCSVVSNKPETYQQQKLKQFARFDQLICSETTLI